MKAIRKRMNKKGFTLVELIIVVAVMAILAAIIVPNMSTITDKFKAKAAQSSCEAIAKELQLLISLDDSSVASLSASDTVVTAAMVPDLGNITVDYEAFDSFRARIVGGEVIVTLYAGSPVAPVTTITAKESIVK